MKKVKNKANPISTWFGGAVWVFKAALVKCRTIIILVNEVSMIINVGAIAISVSVINIRSVPFTCPLPSLYVIAKVLPIFSSLNSSCDSDSPGSRKVVLSSVVPVRYDSLSAAYTGIGQHIYNNMPTENSRHIIRIISFPEKCLFIYLAYSSFLLFLSNILAFSKIPLKSGIESAGCSGK